MAFFALWMKVEEYEKCFAGLPGLKSHPRVKSTSQKIFRLCKNLFSTKDNFRFPFVSDSVFVKTAQNKMEMLAIVYCLPSDEQLQEWFKAWFWCKTYSVAWSVISDQRPKQWSDTNLRVLDSETNLNSELIMIRTMMLWCHTRLYILAEWDWQSKICERILKKQWHWELWRTHKYLDLWKTGESGGDLSVAGWVEFTYYWNNISSLYFFYWAHHLICLLLQHYILFRSSSICFSWV